MKNLIVALTVVYSSYGFAGHSCGDKYSSLEIFDVSNTEVVVIQETEGKGQKVFIGVLDPSKKYTYDLKKLNGKASLEMSYEDLGPCRTRLCGGNYGSTKAHLKSNGQIKTYDCLF